MSTSIGGSAICRPSATFTCGPTAFTCRPVLKTPSNVSWSSSARRRRARRSCSASPTARVKARRIGGSCCSMCRTEVWRLPPNSPSPMARLASGRRSASCGRPRASNAAGCTRPPTSSINCRRASKLPKSQQPKAKRSLQEIWMAETSKDAEAAFDAFITAYQLKYDKAAECLAKDRQALLAFYDFPAEHWKHLRTSTPIESTFATVRHRTIRAKGCLSNKTALAMVFKLVDAAQKSWRRLDGHNQLPKLIQGIRFTDGIEVAANPALSKAQTAAA